MVSAEQNLLNKNEYSITFVNSMVLGPVKAQQAHADTI